MTGVQFQAPTPNEKVAWPSGDYTFHLRGWADRNRDQEPANLRTEFTVSVSDYAAHQIKMLLEANDKFWQDARYSDDARGVPVTIGMVRVGLAATRARRG